MLYIYMLKNLPPLLFLDVVMNLYSIIEVVVQFEMEMIR